VPETRLPALTWFWSAIRMDRDAVLAAFDEQIRRHPEPDAPDGHVEHDDNVVRSMSVGGGWTGVSWCDLDQVSAGRVIAAQIGRFAGLSRPWEWKHYSYDQPPDLPDRLLAAGFTPQPAEALLVAEVAGLALDVPPPPGVDLLPVVDKHGVEALVSVHDEVFGGDYSAVGATLLAGLARQPGAAAAVVAWAGHIPVAAGRVEFHSGTDFASLWGGGTLPAWRGRGLFRSLVAHRAALASARGLRYLQVDASAASRPILQRLGFVELATTTPFTYPGGAGARHGVVRTGGDRP
jgi:ribosomal protein S18 acetylase RimI-like enzyme